MADPGDKLMAVGRWGALEAADAISLAQVGWAAPLQWCGPANASGWHCRGEPGRRRPLTRLADALAGSPPPSAAWVALSCDRPIVEGWLPTGLSGWVSCLSGRGACAEFAGARHILLGRRPHAVPFAYQDVNPAQEKLVRLVKQGLPRASVLWQP